MSLENIFHMALVVMCYINMHTQTSSRGQAESDTQESMGEVSISILKPLLSHWIHTHKKTNKKNQTELMRVSNSALKTQLSMSTVQSLRRRD